MPHIHISAKARILLQVCASETDDERRRRWEAAHNRFSRNVCLDKLTDLQTLGFVNVDHDDAWRCSLTDLGHAALET
jgi:hypothetical protein